MDVRKFLRGNSANRISSMVRTIAQTGNISVDVKNEAGVGHTDLSTITTSDIPAYMEIGFTEQEAVDTALYTAAHEGSHVKHSKTEVMRNYMKYHAEEKHNIEVANALFQIAEDYRVDSLAAQGRPGLADMAKRQVKAMVRNSGGVTPIPVHAINHMGNVLGTPTGGAMSTTERLKVHRTLQAMGFLSSGYDVFKGKASAQWKSTGVDPDLVRDLVSEIKDAVDADLYNPSVGATVASKVYGSLNVPDEDSQDQSDPNGKQNQNQGQGQQQTQQSEQQQQKGENKSEEDEDEDSKGEGKGDGEESKDTSSGKDNSSNDSDKDEEKEEDGKSEGENGEDEDDERPEESPHQDKDKPNDVVDEEDVKNIPKDFTKPVPSSGGNVTNVINKMTKKQLMEMLKTNQAEDVDLKNKLIDAKISVERSQNDARSLDLERRRRLKDSTKQAHYETVRGPKLWSDEHTMKLYKNVCKDGHSGVPIYGADLRCQGNLRKGGRFRLKDNEKKQGKESPYVLREDTYDRLKNEAVMLQRIGHKLGKELAELLREEKDDGYVSDNGAIIANKVYKASKCNNNRVFKRFEHDEVGDYVVQLLVDASGSQSSRIANLNRAMYIIAHACHTAHIPCKITAFNSGSEHFMYVFKDFDDPADVVHNVLGFDADEANRDGLALRLAYEDGLKQRQESNKILIALSDGSPAYHTTVWAHIAKNMGDVDIQNRPSNHPEYDSDVMDTAQAVRDLRKDPSLSLIGMFVSDPNYSSRVLEREQYMYGNDFAYLRDMKIFVPLVIKHIKKCIKG